jgi:hypothetical protein
MAFRQLAIGFEANRQSILRHAGRDPDTLPRVRHGVDFRAVEPSA